MTTYFPFRLDPATCTSTTLQDHLPSKTSTTLDVRRWILANFVLRGVVPSDVSWVNNRILWNGADLRQCSQSSASLALQAWGCEGTGAELIARDIVDAVKKNDTVPWDTDRLIKCLELASGYFFLFMAYLLEFVMCKRYFGAS